MFAEKNEIWKSKWKMKDKTIRNKKKKTEAKWKGKTYRPLMKTDALEKK